MPWILEFIELITMIQQNTVNLSQTAPTGRATVGHIAVVVMSIAEFTPRSDFKELRPAQDSAEDGTDSAAGSTCPA